MKRNRHRTGAPAPARASDRLTTREANLPQRKRRRLFQWAALIVTPLLCLVAVELVLRVARYGYPTNFFLPWNIAGQNSLVENEKFGWRFFPQDLARRPLPLSLNATKPPDTVRIFVLGESAAMGDPEPAYGFSRILEVLLRERFPGNRFEVVNVAFTAINSHVILPIARDCAKQRGDLWIVYMGNNEVMGPFGAGTIFSPQSPHLAIIRTSLALKKLKIGQWMDQMLDLLFHTDSKTRYWTGMDMFLEQQIRPDDPRLARVYDHFQKNLSDLLRVGIRSGAKVVVSTVASNLKDCAPLASLHTPALNQEQLSAWNTAYHEAGVFETAREYVKAVNRYLAAERIDSTYADLQFRLARCYQATANPEEARRRYALARDLDTLRFRADSRLNSIVREVAGGRTEEGILLTDTKELIERHSPNGIPGDEFFFDHVHFNFEGNYLLARNFAEQAAAILKSRITPKDQTAQDTHRTENPLTQPAATLSPSDGERARVRGTRESLSPDSSAIANGAGNWMTPDFCARQLALTGWNRHQMYESMQRRLSSAPFTNQLNHAVRQQRYQAELMELRPMLEPAALQRAAEVYRETLSRSPKDAVSHENFAKLLLSSGNLEAAISEFRHVNELWPHYPAAYYNIGHLLSTQNKASEAERYFRQALKVNSDYGEAYNGLCSIFVSQGKITPAIECFSKALRLKPELWEAHLNLGLMFEKQTNSTQAIASFTKALRLNPNSFAAHLRLGNLLEDQGDVMAAMKHYSDAVRLQPGAGLGQFTEFTRLHPNEPKAYLNLANALATLKKEKEALESLRKAVQLNTNFWEAHYLLGVELATQENLPEAQEHFSEVIRIRPDYSLAHLNLGVALAKQSRLGEAAAQFRETLRLQPTNNAARQYLRTIQSLTNSAR